MLVTWRYRKRKSLIQSFDPRAWIIFYGCFLASTLFFWDLRVLSFFLAIALVSVFTSGIKWHEMARAWIFIGGFILLFSFLTFLTGRGGMELYTQEHLITRLAAGFTVFGWRPALDITVERTFYALSMLVRVFSIASMTILIPYSLNPIQYGITFRGLGLPDKIAYAMDLTMRFIPTFGRDFSLTMDAQRARGYELEKIRGGLFSTVRKLAPLIVPVTIHAIAGSEDIIDAMDLRAFGIGPRTWLEQLHYRRRDPHLDRLWGRLAHRFALHLAVRFRQVLDPFGMTASQPALTPRSEAGGRVLPNPLEDGWRLSIPAGPGTQYRWAQLDDYPPLPRSRFLWAPPVILRLEARVSAPDLPGTWGFGFWNDPFNASLGMGGTARRLPALPNTAWFFYASSPNFLSFRDDLPAQGFLAATFHSPVLPSPLLAAGLPLLPFLRWPWAARSLRRLAGRVIRQASTQIDMDATGWHHYTLDWRSEQVIFQVDGKTVLETPVSPLGRGGLVLWIDNQYAAFTPAGELKFGRLVNPGEAWMELKKVEISK